MSEPTAQPSEQARKLAKDLWNEGFWHDAPAVIQHHLDAYHEAKSKELVGQLFIAVNALEKLENGDYAGTPINRNCGAMNLIRGALKTLPVCVHAATKGEK